MERRAASSSAATLVNTPRRSCLAARSANARGGGPTADRGADYSCFRPGPSFNFMKQLAFESQHGAAAADAARARYRGKGGAAW